MRITALMPIPGIRIPKADKLQRTRKHTVEFIDCETECTVGTTTIEVPEGKDIEGPIRIRAAHFADENHHTIYACTDEGDCIVITPLRGPRLA